MNSTTTNDRRAVIAQSARQVTTLLAAAGSALGIALGAAPSAGALALPPVDRPLISAGTLDFGLNLIGGVPTQGGFLRWDINGAVVQPRLSGFIFAGGGACGRVKVTFYNANHALLGARTTPTACAPSALPVAVNTFSHPNVRHVHVNLQRLNPNGTYTTVGVAIEDL